MMGDPIEKEIADFYGHPHNTINRIMISLYFAYRAAGDYPPDWLRGKRTLVDLPRYGSAATPVVISLSGAFSAREVGKAMVWIVEELHGAWFLDSNGFWFENDQEAIYFKLACG